jgi:hypothetical protein
VLRVEAIVHNTQELRCGRRIERFPKIVSRLRSMAEGFLNNLYCLDTASITNGFLEQLPTPSRVGETRVGGVDISKPRMRSVLSAVLALACSPNGFTVSELVAQVQSRNPQLGYGPRRAAYDLKKLRGKDLIQKKQAHAGTKRHPPACALWPLWSSFARKYSSRFSREWASPRWAGSRTIGPRSMSTTKPYDKTCSYCLKTLELLRRNQRQLFVDVDFLSA